MNNIDLTIPPLSAVFNNACTMSYLQYSNTLNEKCALEPLVVGLLLTKVIF